MYMYIYMYIFKLYIYIYIYIYTHSYIYVYICDVNQPYNTRHSLTPLKDFHYRFFQMDAEAWRRKDAAASHSGTMFYKI